MSNTYAPPYVLKAKDWMVGVGLTALGTVAALAGGAMLFLSLPEQYRLLTSTVGAGLGLLFTAWLYFVIAGKSVEYIDVPDFSPKAIGTGLAVGVVLAALQGGLTLLLLQFGLGNPLGPIAQTVQSQGVGMVAALILVNLVVSAPTEELLYRNVVQKELYTNHSTVVAVLGASLLFTLMHLPNFATAETTGILVSLAEILVNALGYGAAYAYWKRLDVPIVAHGTYNTIVFLIAFLL